MSQVYSRKQKKDCVTLSCLVGGSLRFSYNIWHTNTKKTITMHTQRAQKLHIKGGIGLTPYNEHLSIYMRIFNTLNTHGEGEKTN